MVEIKIYQSKELPDYLKWQILSFLRVHWPDGFVGKNKYRDWITKKEMHPAYVVAIEDDLLISHACVVWKPLTHDRVTYKVYGLAGVFTYPSFRRQGYGLEVLKAARKYIESTDADITVIHSKQRGFYERAGFEPMKNVVTLIGDRKKPTVSKESAFMIFLSKKGRRGRNSFETKPWYFGEHTW